MFRLSNAFAVMTAATLYAALSAFSPASAATGGTDNPERIVLFGARWCAPCTTELASIAELAAAAAPVTLELAWLDYPPVLPRDSASRVRIVPPLAAQAMARAVAGDSYGIPFAIMLDSAERVCASWRGPLPPQQIAVMRQRCRTVANGPAKSGIVR